METISKSQEAHKKYDESVRISLEGIIQWCEGRLKQDNPNTYTTTSILKRKADRIHTRAAKAMSKANLS